MSSTTEARTTSITGNSFAGRANTQRVVLITLGSGPRCLDAWESQQEDFNVVTRGFQNNNTQRWMLTNVGGDLYTIMQISSGRYLDAHEIEGLDFRAVTRPQQNNNTQLWRLIDFGGAFFTIQQLSSGRALEANLTDADYFQVVTRPASGNDLQVWRIVGAEVLPTVVDRSAQFGTPPAAGRPTACVIPGLGVDNIAYRDTSGRLHELWRDAQGATGTTNLTGIAGAPTAVGNPFAYVDTSRNTEILLYRDGAGTVRSLYWSTGPVGHDNLSGSAGAPNAAGSPVGYYTPAADTHHVIYRTGNGHLHELNWTGVAPVVYGGNLTAAIAAPSAAGDPTAFVNAVGENIVVYRSGTGHILSLYWANGPSGLDDLSGVAGTPAAAGDPVGYYTAHDNAHQVVYRAGNGHLYELYWPGVAPVSGWDLSALSGAPAATGNPAAYYSAGTNTKHVIYRSSDGRLHDIRWVPGGGTPAHVDLTAVAGAPPAADHPAAFTVEAPSSQHVAYRGTDNHIYEVRW